jgi:hypothetical protein
VIREDIVSGFVIYDAVRNGLFDSITFYQNFISIKYCISSRLDQSSNSSPHDLTPSSTAVWNGEREGRCPVERISSKDIN